MVVGHAFGPLRAALCVPETVSGRWRGRGGGRCRGDRENYKMEVEMDTFGMMSFKEFVAMKEGLLLPDRPPAKGLSRINPFPTTAAHRKRLHAKPVKPFGPTVQRMKEIVLNKLIPRKK